MFPSSLRAMRVSPRVQAITRHLSTEVSISVVADTLKPPVRFDSNGALRAYILNRPKKLNALGEDMIGLLRQRVEEWGVSDLCGTIAGTGDGRAFCAGGDVATVIGHAADPQSLHKATEFFKHEFELDYILSILPKPYVAVLDGYTMGGGVGLAANAPFRIATENTVFAMPETKIGYCPDVGSTHFLHRLDGELGVYLALTSDVLRGRAVFEHGFATHYVPSRRIPALLQHLTALENPRLDVLDRAIEELSLECQPDEVPGLLTGKTRVALDYAFRHNQVEKIFEDLASFLEHEDEPVRRWAKDTLAMLDMRSPTSLKVALKALRKGRELSLFDALEMELKIATAYCNGASTDFITGVRAVVVEKMEGRPQWSPSVINEVTDEVVSRFFDPDSPFLAAAPKLSVAEHVKGATCTHPMKFALPTEEEIGAVVRGTHSSGGATGMTVEELVSRFEKLRHGKTGIREKVLEVAKRRCRTVDNADGNFIWLRWDHGRPRP